MDIDKIGTTKLDILKDPFFKDKITGFRVRAFQWLRNEWKFKGSVDFENGNTSGTQDFEGKNFDDVVQQMKLFINNLK